MPLTLAGAIVACESCGGRMRVQIPEAHGTSDSSGRNLQSVDERHTHETLSQSERSGAAPQAQPQLPGCLVVPLAAGVGALVGAGMFGCCLGGLFFGTVEAPLYGMLSGAMAGHGLFILVMQQERFLEPLSRRSRLSLALCFGSLSGLLLAPFGRWTLIHWGYSASTIGGSHISGINVVWAVATLVSTIIAYFLSPRLSAWNAADKVLTDSWEQAIALKQVEARRKASEERVRQREVQRHTLASLPECSLNCETDGWSVDEDSLSASASVIKYRECRRLPDVAAEDAIGWLDNPQHWKIETVTVAVGRDAAARRRQPEPSLRCIRTAKGGVKEVVRMFRYCDDKFAVIVMKEDREERCPDTEAYGQVPREAECAELIERLQHLPAALQSLERENIADDDEWLTRLASTLAIGVQPLVALEQIMNQALPRVCGQLKYERLKRHIFAGILATAFDNDTTDLEWAAKKWIADNWDEVK